MHKAALAFLLLAPAAVQAGNYAECILERMPGVQNEAAALAAHHLCLAKFPGGIESVKQGSGRGFFGFDSGAECTLKKAGETRSQRGATIIAVSCRKLYDEPNFFDQFDPQR